MKKYLFVLSTVLLGVTAFAAAPLVQLVPPQPNAQIYQDVNGSINFVDQTTAAIRLKDLQSPINSLSLAPNTTALSSTTLSGQLGYTWVPILLVGTPNAVQGSVLTATSTVNGSLAVCVSTLSIDNPGVIGISTGIFNAGQVAAVAISGVTLALTTGTVNPGQILVTTATAAGYLGVNTNSVFGADVAVALSTGPTAGGLTAVKLRK